jgi:hypothetical protein
LVAEKFTFSVVKDHQVIRETKFFVANQQPTTKKNRGINSTNLAQQSLPALRTSVPILRLIGPLVAEKFTFSVVKDQQVIRNIRVPLSFISQ